MAKTASLKNTIRSRDVPEAPGADASHLQSFGRIIGIKGSSHRLHRDIRKGAGVRAQLRLRAGRHGLGELPAGTGRIEAYTAHQQRRNSV